MHDVLIIGAGAAGLTAAGALSRKGLDCVVVEARKGIGGRMHTVRSPHCALPVELGAEFVHGCPPEILDSGLPVYELDGEQYTDRGRRDGAFWPDVDRILEGMESATGDQSFAAYVGPLAESDEAKHHATRYVESFNAADAERISIRSLVEASHAEEWIQGDRIFRLEEGYQSLVEWLRPRNIDIHLGATVTHVDWSPREVEVSTTAGNFHSRTCLITVPLGVLQAGSIEFTPAIPRPPGLVMGEVIRVALVFDEPFWESVRERAFFLFTDQGHFPTWWTTHPKSSPLLVGWAAGKCARPLNGMPSDRLKEEALISLSALLDQSPSQLGHRLRGFYTHDWQSDPYSLGAYSYAEAGAADAARELARAIEDTLFFAGEATEFTGHSATVHGAMKTGIRAAGEIRQAIQRAPCKQPY